MIYLVLVAPQDIVNVASAVRICRNFGIDGMRVVQPEVELDAYRIEGVAHNTADFIARIEVFDSLDAALADCVHATVLTGRERAAKRRVLRPRDAAPELLLHEASGPVALVAGREAHGLTNDELDRCQTLVTISTDPAYTSLNMAQAIAVMAYETWVARGGNAIPFKAPRRQAPPATQQELEHTFRDWERALECIEFFKTRQRDNVMRSIREVLFRANPDQRESKLLRAMGIEVVNFLIRKGVMSASEAGPASSPQATGRDHQGGR